MIAGPADQDTAEVTAWSPARIAPPPLSVDQARFSVALGQRIEARRLNRRVTMRLTEKTTRPFSRMRV
jgi:hypothetical protein